MIKMELTPKKKGVRILGTRADIDAIYQPINGCLVSLTPEERITYLGVMKYFSTELRRAYLGDRIVKIKRRRLKKWTDETLDAFNNDNPDYTVGLDFSWPHIFFIMASWWELFKNNDKLASQFQILHQFEKWIEGLMKPLMNEKWSILQPYLHGAIYVADPCLFHIMQAVEDQFFADRLPMKRFAEYMSFASYNTDTYKKLHQQLRESSEKKNIPIHEMIISVYYPSKHEI